MTDDKDSSSNIIRFPVEAVTRFGFKRAKQAQPRPTRAGQMEDEGQMRLFGVGADADGPSGSGLGQVVPLPLQMSPFEEALLLDGQGDSRAEEIYLKAIEKDDCAADAWCNLGVLKSIDGDIARAFECFANSLAADPRHAESHYNIGNMYFEVGDLRLARTHYEIALDINPTFASAHFNHGLVTALAEDYPAAYSSLARYKELSTGEDVAIADELMGYIKSAIRLS